MANSLFCTCHSHREKEKRDSRYRGQLLDSMDLHNGAMAPRPVWTLMLPWDSVTATSSWPSKLSAGWETQRSRSGAAGPAADVAPVSCVSVVTGLRSFVWRRLGGLPRLQVVMGEELGISSRQLDDEQCKSRGYKSQVLRDRSVYSQPQQSVFNTSTNAKIPTVVTSSVVWTSQTSLPFQVLAGQQIKHILAELIITNSIWNSSSPDFKATKAADVECSVSPSSQRPVPLCFSIYSQRRKRVIKSVFLKRNVLPHELSNTTNPHGEVCVYVWSLPLGWCVPLCINRVLQSKETHLCSNKQT